MSYYKTDGDIEKARAQINFFQLLLSLADEKASSEMVSAQEEGVRKISFSIDIEVAEDIYQVCLDLALQKLLSSSVSAPVSGSVSGESISAPEVSEYVKNGNRLIEHEPETEKKETYFDHRKDESIKRIEGIEKLLAELEEEKPGENQAGEKG